MVKIFKGNQVTPKKEEIFHWGFTTREGGVIRRFKFPKSDSAIERMRQYVENERNWDRYPGPHPEGGNRNFIHMRIIPDYDHIRIHSLFFPDGKVWDSTLRKFRQTRDYEIKK
jgi:hypothetical protein